MHWMTCYPSFAIHWLSCLSEALFSVMRPVCWGPLSVQSKGTVLRRMCTLLKCIMCRRLSSNILVWCSHHSVCLCMHVCVCVFMLMLIFQWLVLCLDWRILWSRMSSECLKCVWILLLSTATSATRLFNVTNLHRLGENRSGLESWH